MGERETTLLFYWYLQDMGYCDLRMLPCPVFDFH